MRGFKLNLKSSHIILLLLGILFFILGNWFLSLTYPDEGKNAFPVLHMLQTKNFLIPYYNCHPRFEKPPMLYWIGVISSYIFGLNEFSLRLISGISALGVYLFTYLIAKKYFNENIALKSALILLTIPHMWVEARAFTPEMLLNFFSVGAIYFFINKRLLLGWLFLGLGVLTKGPVGVILPLVILFGFKCYDKNINLFNFKGLLIFIIVSISWYVYMLIHYGYNYFYSFFLYQNIYRYLGTKSIHSYPFYYYFVIILLSTVFYIPVYFKFTSNFKTFLIKLKTERFQICSNTLFPFVFWFIFVFLFYTIAKNKLHHYILLCYPSLSVILANYVSEKYLKIVLSISCFLLLFCLVFIHSYEEKRFVHKVKPLITDSSKHIEFYNTEISSIIFYARRCIFKHKDREPLPDFIITEKKYANRFPECKKIIEAPEFRKTFVLLECK